MSTAAQQALADQKRAVRSDVRRALKALSPDQRATEGDPSLQPPGWLERRWSPAARPFATYNFADGVLAPDSIK
jgi:5-formyltetrahydrofolate cyclo-ligase